MDRDGSFFPRQTGRSLIRLFSQKGNYFDSKPPNEATTRWPCDPLPSFNAISPAILSIDRAYSVSRSFEANRKSYNNNSDEDDDDDDD